MKKLLYTLTLGLPLTLVGCGGGGDELVRTDDTTSRQNAMGIPATTTTGLGRLGAKGPRVAVAANKVSASTAPLPAAVDLRAYAVPVGDQGGIGSCVAWTIAYEILGWYANYQRAPVAQLTPKSFAPMFMYNQINGGVDEGAYPVDGFALLVNKGNDTRKNYFQGDWNWITAPTQQEFTNAAQYKIGAYKVLFASSVGKGGVALQASLQNALANNTPVAITIPVRDGFDRVGTGVVDDITTPSRGLHEVTVLGYDATGILIQNHWGVNWGNKGFARLSWKVVQNDVLEAIVVTTPPKFPKAAPFTRFIGAVNNLF